MFEVHQSSSTFTNPTYLPTQSLLVQPWEQVDTIKYLCESPVEKKVVHHDTNTQGHTHEAIDIQMCEMRNLWKYLYKCVVGDNTNNIVLHTECGATVVIWSAGSQAGEVNKGGSPVSETSGESGCSFSISSEKCKKLMENREEKVWCSL